MPSSLMNYKSNQEQENEFSQLGTSYQDELLSNSFISEAETRNEVSDYDILDLFKNSQGEIKQSLEKLKKRRNGKPRISTQQNLKVFDLTSKNLGSLDALMNDRSSIDLKSGGSNLLGLGSSGHGGDFGYESLSYGHEEENQQAYGPSTQCLNGLNPLLLLLTGALALAGYYFLYTRLTAIAGKRKKRDLHVHDGIPQSFFNGGYDLAGSLIMQKVAQKA